MKPTNARTTTDPRVRRTRKLLRDALVSLLLEKDLAAISIKEITDRAEVAYITFFRHYESQDALLMEVLEDGLGQLLGHIESLARQSGDTAVETEGRLIFEYIRQNADLFRILLKSQSVVRIRRRVVRNIAAIFRRDCMPLARSSNATTAALAANHIATSILSLIEWWLENKLNPPPAEMGKIYKGLIIDSTVGAVKTLSHQMARA